MPYIFTHSLTLGDSRGRKLLIPLNVREIARALYYYILNLPLLARLEFAADRIYSGLRVACVVPRGVQQMGAPPNHPRQSESIPRRAVRPRPVIVLYSYIIRNRFLGRSSLQSAFDRNGTRSYFKCTRICCFYVFLRTSSST